MAEGSSRGLKRALEDDDSKPPAEKRARFPKGKKVKQGDYVIGSVADNVPSGKEIRLVVKDRAMRRTKITAELLNDETTELIPDVRKAEVHYKDDGTFLDEGVQIEPFNLEKEREDGYFDENGNYVEYMNPNEIKDAWLDSVDVCPMYKGKKKTSTENDEKSRELSTEELAEINRRISNVLEPGETVLQGLRRLKGTSTDKKKKMPADTKHMFDQLTDDAMKLMDNGDYNVYDEKQESFKREAEGYENIAEARKNAAFGSNQEKPDDDFDMFGDDDIGIGAEKPASSGTGSVSAQPSEGGDNNDYVYDESSGYYYSSSLGYYYDPSSGYYCCATSGKWYLYNEATEKYDEIQEDAIIATTS